MSYFQTNKQKQKKNCRFLGPFPFASPLLQSALKKKNMAKSPSHNCTTAALERTGDTDNGTERDSRERKKKQKTGVLSIFIKALFPGGEWQNT